MAPLPKRRHTSTRARLRTRAKRLTASGYILCPSCGKPTTSHRICPHCGYYDGNMMLAQKQKHEDSK